MSAVASLYQWRPQIATTAALCLLCSCVRSVSLEQLLVLWAEVSPSVLLGLCIFPLAGLAAAYQASAGGGSSSSPRPLTSKADKVHKQQEQAHHSSSSSSLSMEGTLQPPGLGSKCSSVSSSRQPVRLAESPFVGADLSLPLGSTRRQLYGSSQPRRRRLPRLSIELTPLPRLSVDFSGYRGQHYSSSSMNASRQSSIRRSLDRCSMLPPGASSTDLFVGSSSFWDTASCGIIAEFNGAAAAAAGGSGLVGCGSLQLQQQLPTLAVGETTESLGTADLPAGLGFMEELINETHLLQVGAILGEVSARGALAAREAGGPVGHPSSFYGSADTLDHGDPWELLISEGNDNVMYWGWRKPLRKGLYMYMTRSLFLGASPAELRAFMMDDAYRAVWDSSVNVLRPVVNAATCSSGSSSTAATTAASCSTVSSTSSSSAASSNAAVEAMAAATAARISISGGGADGGCAEGAGSTSTSSCSSSSSPPSVLPHECALMQALVQFPKPMASRSYLYARRVWPRPSDGGCYCLSKSCESPAGTPAVPALPGRSVGVDDYCSGCVIRTPSPQLLPPGTDPAAPAAEVFMVYFEDSHVRPGLANLGIKKGLWPLVQRTEKALRVYQAGAAANSHLQQASAERSGGTSAATSPRPAATAANSMSRSASLGSVEFGGSSPSRPLCAAGLSRSVSMQETGQHTRRLSSASLPCYPVELDGDMDAGEVQDCCCSCSNPMQAPTDDCTQSMKQPQKVEQQSSKSSSSWGGWLGRVSSTVCGVIKQSGQLLAAASVVLWRSGPSFALMLPRFEWRVLNWAYQHITAPRQLLLGASAATSAVSAAATPSLVRLSSHPLAEWASQVVRRLPSHPISTEDWVQGAAAADGSGPSSAIATMQAGPVLQLRLAYAAAAAGSSTAGSCVDSTAGSDVASFSLSCSSCGCSCGGCRHGSTAGGSSSSRRCHRPDSSSSSGGGSVVRDESGGRRHRRVVVKLVQTAGLRVARRVARLTGITE